MYLFNRPSADPEYYDYVGPEYDGGYTDSPRFLEDDGQYDGGFTESDYNNNDYNNYY